MPSTYEKIATSTLGGAAATISFTSITGTYTDLVLVGTGLVSSNSFGVWLQINGDTGTNYSWTDLAGNGTAASSSRQSSRNNTENWLGNASAGWSNTNNNNLIANIMNYSNSTTYKTVLTRGNNPSGGVEAMVNLWRNTAAITSLTVGVQSTGTLSSGTTFTLYGIKAA